MTTTAKAIKLAQQKGISLSSDVVNGKRVYSYSNDGFNWTVFNGNMNQLVKFLS